MAGRIRMAARSETAGRIQTAGRAAGHTPGAAQRLRAAPRLRGAWRLPGALRLSAAPAAYVATIAPANCPAAGRCLHHPDGPCGERTVLAGEGMAGPVDLGCARPPTVHRAGRHFRREMRRLGSAAASLSVSGQVAFLAGGGGAVRLALTVHR